MAELKALLIRGIRSFSPDDNGQVIRFQKPLTLILGSNGSGKTTIIECIKYAAIGLMPPGSKGSVFVHDPKIADSVLVRAQVKLKFVDAAGAPAIVTRSLTCTQKGGRVECRTVDGTIQRKINDKMTSLSMKCVEVDEELTALLGVSKAVLDNVIFCHQEEATWPLSEPKVLKEKFDDLFSASRYSKCLDEIKKIRQNLKSSINESKAELKYLKKNKEKAAEITNELANLREECKLNVQNLENLQSQLAPMQQQLNDINKSLEFGAEMERRIESLKMKHKMHSATIAELKGKLKEPFQGSDEALNGELNNFENSLEENSFSLASVRRKVVAIEGDCERERKSRDELVVKKSQAFAEFEFLKNKHNAMNELVAQLCEQLNFQGAPSSVVLQKLKKTVGEVLSEFEERKKCNEQSMNEVRLRVMEAQNMLKVTSKSLVDTNDKTEDEQKCLEKIERELRQHKMAQKEMGSVEEEAKRVSAELEQLDKSDEEVKLKADVENLSAQKFSCTEEMNAISVKIPRAQQLDSIRTELQIWHDEMLSKEQQVVEKMQKHQKTIDISLKDAKPENLRKVYDDCLQSKENNLATLRDAMQRSEVRYKETVRETNAITDQLDAITKQLLADEENINSTQLSCVTSYEDEVKSLTEQIEKLQFEKDTCELTKRWYEKYKVVVQQNGSCPLCRRSFQEGEEQKKMIEQLNEELDHLPNRRQTVANSLVDITQQRERLISLRPVIERVEVVKSSTLPDLEKKQKMLFELMDNRKKESERLSKQHERLYDEIKRLNQARDDAFVVESLYKDIVQLKEKCDAHKATLERKGVSESTKELLAALEEKQTALCDLTMQLEERQERLSEFRDKVQALRNRSHTINEKRMRIVESEKQATLLTRQLCAVKDGLGKLLANVETLRQDVEKWKAKEKNMRLQLKSMENDCDVKWKEEDAKTVLLSQKVQQVEQLDNYLKQNRLDDCENSLKVLETKLTEVEDKLKQFESVKLQEMQRQSELNDVLVRAEVVKRQLEDNVKLRTEEKLAGQCKAEICQLEQDFKEKGFKHQAVNAEQLNKAYCEQLKEYHELVGRKTILEQSLDRLEKDLQSEQYVDADNKYDAKSVDLISAELVEEDLLKYSLALDTAIIKHHHMMMEQINWTIKELWESVYKGDDIESIEIKSEEFTLQLEKKRIYNYRLVMYRNGVEIDMRGRCSAGQKMLASIIVRLALSEVFSNRCGFFALDEPTTNLDAANRDSLAAALVNIMQSRATDSHFQLILITHDDHFVQKIAQSWPLDVFYRVSKNDQGCSKITEQYVQDLPGM